MVISFLMNATARSLPDLVILFLVLVVQYVCAASFLKRPTITLAQSRIVITLAGLSGFLLCFGFLLNFVRIAAYFPVWMASWVRGAALMWAMISLLWLGSWLAYRALAPIVKPERSAARRAFLEASGAALVAAPVAAIGYGVFVQRMNIRLREQNILIPNLAEALDGIRIVQLTDIHLSPFLSEKELARAVAMANETHAHLALVTGDMISGKRDPLDRCLQVLSNLRAEAGIYGCMGNHEIYAGAESYAKFRGAQLGLQYLRMESARLKFGGAEINLAGVDYQRFHEPYLVGAQAMVEPGVLNVLMSHNPDVFPVAARQGYDLTLAGHTHGGQVRVEILREDLNIARFFTPYVDGLYTEGGRAIWVSRGIGTIGVPARLGAPPEVALLRLCRS
jgi:predicted MPP superfamily phosphohydrolase